MLPWDLPNLLLAKGRHQTRTLGLTPAGDPAAYPRVHLTPEQLDQYFREGYVVVSGMLPTRVLDSVRTALWNEIGPASWPWAHNGFMTVDALLDLYVFSSMPGVAAQVFGHAEADTTDKQEGLGATHLWSDFHYFRPSVGAPLVKYHIDGMECEGMLPANRTTSSRLRFWVTLEDSADPLLLINQSFFERHLTADEREMFASGGGRGLDTAKALEQWHQEGRFGNANWTDMFTRVPRLDRGDVIMHSPCLAHSSPKSFGRPSAFVCPTYAPAESRTFSAGNAGAPHRSCARSVPLNETIGGRRDPCIPQVFPRDPSFHKGAKLNYEVQDYSAGGSVLAWWVYRLVHAMAKPEPPRRDGRGAAEGGGEL